MGSLSLANKYRPRTFREVLGQVDTIKILSNILETQSYPPALLLLGGWGSGKTTLARIFSNSVLCTERKTADPCGVCSICRQFQSDPSKVSNYREIDAGSEGSVKDVRDIIEEAQFRPIEGAGRRVLLLDECHMLTNQAQNAFLKLLEEGSRNMLFLFCTTDPDKMLRTIFSRTLPFRIAEIPKGDIVARLEEVCRAESITYEVEALSLIVAVKKGHVRDCFMLLDQLRRGLGVTVDSVKRVLNLDLEAEFYRLLYLVPGEPGPLLERVDSLLQRVSVRELYDGVSRAALTSFKYGSKIHTGLPESDLVWCQKVFSQIGERTLRVARFLTAKVAPSSQVSLECELFMLKHFLETGFPDEPRSVYMDSEIKPKFSSKIEELRYSARKNQVRDEEKELEMWQTVDLLRGYPV